MFLRVNCGSHVPNCKAAFLLIDSSSFGLPNLQPKGSETNKPHVRVRLQNHRTGRSASVNSQVKISAPDPSSELRSLMSELEGWISQSRARSSFRPPPGLAPPEAFLDLPDKDKDWDVKSNESTSFQSSTCGSDAFSPTGSVMASESFWL